MNFFKKIRLISTFVLISTTVLIPSMLPAMAERSLGYLGIAANMVMETPPDKLIPMGTGLAIAAAATCKESVKDLTTKLSDTKTAEAALEERKRSAEAQHDAGLIIGHSTPIQGIPFTPTVTKSKVGDPEAILIVNPSIPVQQSAPIIADPNQIKTQAAPLSETPIPTTKQTLVVSYVATPPSDQNKQATAATNIPFILPETQPLQTNATQATAAVAYVPPANPNLTVTVQPHVQDNHEIFSNQERQRNINLLEMGQWSMNDFRAKLDNLPDENVFRTYNLYLLPTGVAYLKTRQAFNQAVPKLINAINADKSTYTETSKRSILYFTDTTNNKNYKVDASVHEQLNGLAKGISGCPSIKPRKTTIAKVGHETVRLARKGIKKILNLFSANKKKYIKTTETVVAKTVSVDNTTAAPIPTAAPTPATPTIPKTRPQTSDDQTSSAADSATIAALSSGTLTTPAAPPPVEPPPGKDPKKDMAEKNTQYQGARKDRPAQQIEQPRQQPTNSTPNTTQRGEDVRKAMKELLKKQERHVYSKDHINKKILNLGEKEAINEAISDIVCETESRYGLNPNGDTQIQTELMGEKFEIRVNCENGKPPRGMTAFRGHSSTARADKVKLIRDNNLQPKMGNSTVPKTIIKEINKSPTNKQLLSAITGLFGIHSTPATKQNSTMHPVGESAVAQILNVPTSGASTPKALSNTTTKKQPAIQKNHIKQPKSLAQQNTGIQEHGLSLNNPDLNPETQATLATITPQQQTIVPKQNSNTSLAKTTTQPIATTVQTQITPPTQRAAIPATIKLVVNTSSQAKTPAGPIPQAQIPLPQRRAALIIAPPSTPIPHIRIPTSSAPAPIITNKPIPPQATTNSNQHKKTRLTAMPEISTLAVTMLSNSKQPALPTMPGSIQLNHQSSFMPPSPRLSRPPLSLPPSQIPLGKVHAHPLVSSFSYVLIKNKPFANNINPNRQISHNNQRGLLNTTHMPHTEARIITTTPRSATITRRQLEIPAKAITKFSAAISSIHCNYKQPVLSPMPRLTHANLTQPSITLSTARKITPTFSLSKQTTSSKQHSPLSSQNYSSRQKPIIAGPNAAPIQKSAPTTNQQPTAPAAMHPTNAPQDQVQTLRMPRHGGRDKDILNIIAGAYRLGRTIVRKTGRAIVYCADSIEGAIGANRINYANQQNHFAYNQRLSVACRSGEYDMKKALQTIEEVDNFNWAQNHITSPTESWDQLQLIDNVENNINILRQAAPDKRIAEDAKQFATLDENNITKLSKTNQIALREASHLCTLEQQRINAANTAHALLRQQPRNMQALKTAIETSMQKYYEESALAERYFALKDEPSEDGILSIAIPTSEKHPGTHLQQYNRNSQDYSNYENTRRASDTNNLINTNIQHFFDYLLRTTQELNSIKPSYNRIQTLTALLINDLYCNYITLLCDDYAFMDCYWGSSWSLWFWYDAQKARNCWGASAITKLRSLDPGIKTSLETVEQHTRTFTSQFAQILEYVNNDLDAFDNLMVNQIPNYLNALSRKEATSTQNAIIFISSLMHCKNATDQVTTQTAKPISPEIPKWVQEAGVALEQEEAAVTQLVSQAGGTVQEQDTVAPLRKILRDTLTQVLQNAQTRRTQYEKLLTAALQQQATIINQPATQTPTDTKTAAQPAITPATTTTIGSPSTTAVTLTCVPATSSATATTQTANPSNSNETKKPAVPNTSRDTIVAQLNSLLTESHRILTEEPAELTAHLNTTPQPANNPTKQALTNLLEQSRTLRANLAEIDTSLNQVLKEAPNTANAT